MSSNSVNNLLSYFFSICWQCLYKATIYYASQAQMDTIDKLCTYPFLRVNHASTIYRYPELSRELYQWAPSIQWECKAQEYLVFLLHDLSSHDWRCMQYIGIFYSLAHEVHNLFYVFGEFLSGNSLSLFNALFHSRVFFPCKKEPKTSRAKGRPTAWLKKTFGLF
jgi:hypothetical protein